MNKKKRIKQLEERVQVLESDQFGTDGQIFTLIKAMHGAMLCNVDWDEIKQGVGDALETRAALTGENLDNMNSGYFQAVITAAQIFARDDDEEDGEGEGEGAE